MDDFVSLEKNVIRELSCRLCLCKDVIKLKPLNAETKRKIQKLFGILIRNDDILPKAICHACQQQLHNIYLFTVKVEKTQKFLDFYVMKNAKEKKDKTHPVVITIEEKINDNDIKKTNISQECKLIPDCNHGDIKENTTNTNFYKNKSTTDIKPQEHITLDEFVKIENIDKTLLQKTKNISESKNTDKNKVESITEVFDPIVLINGKPAKEGIALDKQISLFYKMECCICNETGFHFRSLMKHYKDRHGVPGYVTCCNKKFHYFYPKRLIEHMAYHLQPNIFM